MGSPTTPRPPRVRDNRDPTSTSTPVGQEFYDSLPSGPFNSDISVGTTSDNLNQPDFTTQTPGYKKGGSVLTGRGKETMAKLNRRHGECV